MASSVVKLEQKSHWSKCPLYSHLERNEVTFSKILFEDAEILARIPSYCTRKMREGIEMQKREKNLKLIVCQFPEHMDQWNRIWIGTTLQRSSCCERNFIITPDSYLKYAWTTETNASLLIAEDATSYYGRNFCWVLCYNDADDSGRIKL